jgi:fatty acid desaturase
MKPAVADIAGNANNLVRDLNRVKPEIYWADLLITSAIGWAAFAVALRTQLPLSILPLAIAIFALYRGLCFIHEISHQSERTLPGFELAWNILIGFPLLLPSLMYDGVHREHHRLATYGTEADPEYLPFAQSARMTAAFIVQSLALPAFLAVRYLLLAPLAYVIPPLERVLVARASSLCLNVRFLRAINTETLRMVRLQSAGILLMWTTIIATVATGHLPPRILVERYVVLAFISLINTLRTLGAHAYQSDGTPLSREEQLEDSIDTPGFKWGALWAPVGLRFHGLHHYFPGIPYHNLGQAYRRLRAELPPEAPIHHVQSAGLWHSLSTLFQNGLQQRER